MHGKKKKKKKKERVMYKGCCMWDLKKKQIK